VRGAQGKVIRPPMPGWLSQNKKGVIDVTPQRESETPYTPTFYVHPVVLELESALLCDSIRTLCRVLAGAGGTIYPAIDNPDRTEKPILSAALTIRALLRFVDLRHGASDDITTADFRGKCGSGLNVLLRKCRDNISEVCSALENRADETVKLIRAFYDQEKIIRKYQPFFRQIIRQGIPGMLRLQGESLPRLISFLEPYGEIQLDFLYEAAKTGTFSARRTDFEAAQLLETAEAWAQKARSGRLAIIVANQVRVVVLGVIGLDVELSAEQRMEWMVAALWASVPEMTPEIEILEGRLRGGMIQRGDPGELFPMAVLICQAGVVKEELFQLLGKHLRKAFAGAESSYAREVLMEISPASHMTYPQALNEVLMHCSAGFAKSAPLDQLEGLLNHWIRRRFKLDMCREAIATSLMMRDLASLSPGHLARCGLGLSALGVRDARLEPLLGHLLGSRWASVVEKVQQPMRGATGQKVSGMCRALELLGKLWGGEDASLPVLAEVGAILRLIGPTATPRRAADEAADALISRFAAQLPGFQAEVVGVVEAWREAASQGLAAVVAPFLLRAAQQGGEVALADMEAGDVARATALLSNALRGDALSLQSAEWTLSPFVGSGPDELGVAVETVAGACGKCGAPKALLSAAARRWLRAGGPSGGLGSCVVVEALKAWEIEGVSGAGLARLREAHTWLVQELDLNLEQSSPSPSRVESALQGINMLLTTIDGEAPSLADLKRAREGCLANLGRAGEAALADAVALAWSAEMPGLTTSLAAGHFDQWWKGFEDSRSLVQQLVAGSIDELRWKTELRAQATWQGELPINGQTPAWRIEGGRKVPWFIPTEVVEEFFQEKAVKSARPGAVSGEKGFINMKVVREKAKKSLGGRCMYCGSGHELVARLVWPLELGGQNLESNLSAVCSLCAQFKDRLGPRRWGEVLDAKPEDAADIWWTAQKKASMKSAAFLQNQR